MTERLLLLFVAHPAAFRFACSLLASVAFSVLALGWRMHYVLAALEYQLGRAGVEAPRSLAALYPSLPTWWIPESAEGFTCYVALVFAGFGVSLYARRVERLLR